MQRRQGWGRRRAYSLRHREFLQLHCFFLGGGSGFSGAPRSPRKGDALGAGLAGQQTENAVGGMQGTARSSAVLTAGRVPAGGMFSKQVSL